MYLIVCLPLVVMESLIIKYGILVNDLYFIQWYRIFRDQTDLKDEKIPFNKAFYDNPYHMVL